MSDLSPREYLRSKGIAVGERGRFSAEQQAILAEAGYDVSKPLRKVVAEKAPKPEKAKVVKAPRVKVEQKQVRSRKDKNFVAVSGNVRVVHDVCFSKAHYGLHTIFCDCPNGPVPPKGFVAVDNGSGLV